MRKSKLDRSDLPTLVAQCTSVTEVLIRVGLDPTGSNFHTFKKYAKKYNADYAHFQPAHFKVAYTSSKGGTTPQKWSAILVENSTYSKSALRKRLVRSGLLPYVCVICGNAGSWAGQHLTLVLDHINGVYDDHRLENLRWLCPNCNSQTVTFAGRNKQYKR